jgi:hypothetical protein
MDGRQFFLNVRGYISLNEFRGHANGVLDGIRI